MTGERMSSLIVSVLVLLFGGASGLTREYIAIASVKNWTDAQFICRQCFRDLAVITTEQENKRLHTILGNTYKAWIGMYRPKVNVSFWNWSDHTPTSYYQWDTIQLNNKDGNQTCVEITPAGWNDQFCFVEQFYVCYRFLVLVKEKMTWDEAFQYCRRNYTNLASITHDTKLQLAEMEGNQTQTDRVWTGLRFLNGNWFWVSMESLGKLVRLPLCPNSRYRCAALNTKTRILESRDCTEKLNFLCHY